MTRTLAALVFALAAAAAQAASPRVAVGQGVEFVACLSRGHQGTVTGYYVPPGYTLETAPQWRLLYDVRVFPRAGGWPYRVRVSDGCIRPVEPGR